MLGGIIGCSSVSDLYPWIGNTILTQRPGPKANPASLPSVDSPEITIYDHFAQLFQAAVETSTSPNPVRFMSRYDKSAANIKESNLWSAIGQTPWSYPYSNWYHRYVDFPFAALRAAAQLGEYTITDRGTWLSVDGWIRDSMDIFVTLTLCSTGLGRSVADLFWVVNTESKYGC